MCYNNVKEIINIGDDNVTMQEISRLIIGLRNAGWSEKKINDFLLYIESGNEEYIPESTNK